MLDKTILYFENNLKFENFGINEDVFFYDIVFHPDRSKVNCIIYRYVGYLQNMRIEMYKDRIEIIGSITTFYQGHNACDLSFNELEIAFDKLSKIFDVTTKELKVKLLEFGFTIPIKLRVSEVLANLIKHKNGRIEEQTKGINLVEKKFRHSNYILKYYDKGVEQSEKGNKIEGYNIRIEQVFKKKHIPKSIQTIADLLQKDSIGKLFIELLAQWNCTLKKPTIDTAKFTQLQLYTYYAKLNPLFWNEIKRRNKNTAKIGFARFKKHLLEVGDFSIYVEIETSIKEKYNLLLANENANQFQPIIKVGKRVHNLIDSSKRSKVLIN